MKHAKRLYHEIPVLYRYRQKNVRVEAFQIQTQEATELLKQFAERVFHSIIRLCERSAKTWRLSTAKGLRKSSFSNVSIPLGRYACNNCDAR